MHAGDNVMKNEDVLTTENVLVLLISTIIFRSVRLTKTMAPEDGLGPLGPGWSANWTRWMMMMTKTPHKVMLPWGHGDDGVA